MTDHDAADFTDEAEAAPARLPLSSMAIASFVLGLFSLTTLTAPAFGSLLAVLAVVFGHTGRREIKQGLKSGWGYDIAGMILGYLVLAAFVLSSFVRR